MLVIIPHIPVSLRWSPLVNMTLSLMHTLARKEFAVSQQGSHASLQIWIDQTADPHHFEW